MTYLRPAERELREKAKKVLPGPGALETWREDFDRESWRMRHMWRASPASRNDACFIAAASPSTVTALLGEIAVLREALAERMEAITAWRHVADFSEHCSFCAAETWPHTTFHGVRCPTGWLCELDDDVRARSLLVGMEEAEG